VVFGSEMRAFVELRLKRISFMLHNSESMMRRMYLNLQIRTLTGIWRRCFCPSRQSGNWTSIADGTLFRKIFLKISRVYNKVCNWDPWA
jgi:hypothetical protein